MDTATTRDDRTIQLFGADAFERIRRAHVVLAGVGGLGTHNAVELAYLGVGAITPIDDEDVTDTNMNRYVGAVPADVGRPKVEVIADVIKRIRPETHVNPIRAPLQSKRAFDAIKSADWTLAGVDNDGARLVLTHLCAAYEKNWIDLATDTENDNGRIRFGGRIIVATGDGCPYCFGEIDSAQAARELVDPALRAARDKIYGVEKGKLNGTGPAVVSINGTVASLGVTELMMLLVGQPVTRRVIVYRGDLARVTVRTDKREECPYCDGFRGQREAAAAERFLEHTIER